MAEADIPAILEIQAACYTELVPESDESLRAKLRASPGTCQVACLSDRVVAYLISIPWERSKPPALDARTCKLPPAPDCLYLHDLAVLPSARHSGAGRALVDATLAQLEALSLGHASLIAVQSSAAYWKRYGFNVVEPSEALRAKLSTYGTGAVYMELEAGHAARPS
jgi:predicted N-acetyltransferase YhbS